MVATDHHTRYAETKAIPTSTDVTQLLLDQIFLKYGVSWELLSDRKQAFLSKVIPQNSSVLLSYSQAHNRLPVSDQWPH